MNELDHLKTPVGTGWQTKFYRGGGFVLRLQRKAITFCRKWWCMKQMIVAQRGRGTSMEKSATKWKQKLEVRTDDLCNSLTTVSKDNLVLEIHDDREEDT